MGATRRQVRTIFALQGTLLSGFGGLLGAGAGVLVVQFLSGIEGPPTASGRREPIFPFELSAELIVTTIVVAAVLGFLASIVPARRASKVDPIEVIRSG
jgi:lipoprotein-releasing system permease protein